MQGNTKALAQTTRMRIYDLALKYYLWIVFVGFGKGLNSKKALEVMKEIRAKIERDTMLKIYSELR